MPKFVVCCFSATQHMCAHHMAAWVPCWRSDLLKMVSALFVSTHVVAITPLTTTPVTAPLLFSQVYQHTVAYTPNAFILVGAGLQGLCFVLLLFMRPPPASLQAGDASASLLVADAEEALQAKVN